LQRVYRKPVGEYSIGADEIVRGHMKSILDPSFRYTSSVDTDLQKTFARIRRDYRQEAERAVQATRRRARQGFVDRQEDSDGPVMKRALSASLSIVN